ncbi:MAG: cytochrome ubiquinol oxidase subunit I [Pseudomonadota bacterium]
MDPVILARIQFALTIGFHFLFPPITIGLAWLLVIVETRAWRTRDPRWERIGQFFAKLLALTFAVGVATGVVMEFQFGTNWGEYSKYVGDIFGAPLAAEGIFAFFMESTFIGLYIFGRDKVSKGVHWFSALMIAVGSTLSAFWILVANSWQQTPAGFTPGDGRVELASFSEAVFNPSMWPRFFHTIDAALIAGAFFMSGIAAYFLWRRRGPGDDGPHSEAGLARTTLVLGLVFGFIASLLELMPFGHWHAQQVAQTQPAKFAAIEGLYTSTDSAPMVLFGIPDAGQPPKLLFPVEIDGLLSWLAFGDEEHPVQGLDQFPKDETPPLWLTFVSFHNMVVLGMYFIFITGLGLVLLWRRKLFTSRWYLKLLTLSIPLPLAACQLGWITAEVGRQPWAVYGLLRTADAVSVTVTAGEILASIIMFSLVYLCLGGLYLFILVREVRHGFPGPAPAPKEGG